MTIVFLACLQNGFVCVSLGRMELFESPLQFGELFDDGVLVVVPDDDV